jgi:hypothetical protein
MTSASSLNLKVNPATDTLPLSISYSKEPQDGFSGVVGIENMRNFKVVPHHCYLCHKYEHAVRINTKEQDYQFYCQTPEKVQNFVQQLVEKTNSPFSLSARLVIPRIDDDPTNGKTAGAILFQFSDRPTCDAFSQAISSSFFPGSKEEHDSISMKITLTGDTKADVVTRIRKGLDALSQRDKKVNESVWTTASPLFPGKLAESYDDLVDPTISTTAIGISSDGMFNVRDRHCESAIAVAQAVAPIAYPNTTRSTALAPDSAQRRRGLVASIEEDQLNRAIELSLHATDEDVVQAAVAQIAPGIARTAAVAQDARYKAEPAGYAPIAYAPESAARVTQFAASVLSPGAQSAAPAQHASGDTLDEYRLRVAKEESELAYALELSKRSNANADQQFLDDQKG